MEDFKRIGYKNSFSTWVLLIGTIVGVISTVAILRAKPDNYILIAMIFFILSIIFLVSFIFEKKRPKVVVFLSNNSVKIWNWFKWKVILFDDIVYVDYKINVLREVDAYFLGVGWLIIGTGTQRFVVRNIKEVRYCYEDIIEKIKEYQNTEEKVDK